MARGARQPRPALLLRHSASARTSTACTPSPRRGRTPPQNPVRYPFRSFDGGSVIDRQRSGTRVYDINTDGVDHYGLYPDWIEDLRLVAGRQIVDDMANGAEAYLQMWERAEAAAALAAERLHPPVAALAASTSTSSTGACPRRACARCTRASRRRARWPHLDARAPIRAPRSASGARSPAAGALARGGREQVAADVSKSPAAVARSSRWTTSAIAAGRPWRAGSSSAPKQPANSRDGHNGHMEGSAQESVGTQSSWLRCYRCWSQNLEVQLHYEGILKVDADTGEAVDPVEEVQEAVVQCLDCLHDQPHLALTFYEENGRRVSRVEPVEDRWERMVTGTPWVASCTVTVDADQVESCSGPEAAESLAFAAFGDHGTREFFTHVRFHKHEDERIVIHMLVELYARSADEATEVMESAARGSLTITSLAEESRPPASSADEPH